MRTKVIAQRMAALERIIDALAEDLIESTDEELLQAARDLGMDPTMRGSAAFVGIKYPATWRYSDFFEVPIRQPEPVRADEGPKALSPASKRLRGPKKSSE